jgi:hypothetical protein
VWSQLSGQSCNVNRVEEIEWRPVDWTHLAQDRDKFEAFH